MKRRRCWLLGGLALSMGAGFVLLASLGHVPETRQRYDRITVGMTYHEVERLVGHPPGSYVSDPDDIPLFWQVGHDRSDSGASIGSWLFDDGYILIYFDRADRVEEKTWQTNGTPPFWERVRGWLGW